MKMEYGRIVGDIKLSDLIKGNYVYFDSLRQGFAYYKLQNTYIAPHIPKEHHHMPEIIERFTCEDYYLFTIPLDDIGNGTLKAKMKAIEVMRWIRKAFESGELIKIK